MQVREATGFGNAEGGGSVFARVLNLTVACVVVSGTAEQTFTAGLSLSVLGGDILIAAHSASAAQTSGVIALPGRVTSLGSIAIQFSQTGSSTNATALAPLTTAFYNLVFLRR